MKRTLSILLTLLLVVLLFAACGGNDTPAVNEGIGEGEISGEPEGTGAEGSVSTEADALVYNLLTGETTLAADREGLRPYAISIDDINITWPQYAISYADIVYEIETEGGIPRLMCLYSDIRADGEITRLGNVRSLRDHFIELIYPFNPIIVHCGTSTFAYDVLNNYSIDTLDLDIISDLWFYDYDRINSGITSDHCKYVSPSSIASVMEDIDMETESWSNIPAFNFCDEGETVTLSGGTANRVYFHFDSSGAVYNNELVYNADDGLYYKWSHTDDAHTDGLNGEQLAFDNCLLLTADEMYNRNGSVKNPVYVNYNLGGTGYYFTGGNYVEVTWSKGRYDENLEILDANGQDVVFNTGKTYVAIIRTEYADSIEIS